MAADTIAVKSEETALAWIAQAKELNSLTHGINLDVGGVLQGIAEDAGGPLIDTLCNMGKAVLDGAEKILDGVTLITEGVNQVVNVVKDVAGLAKNAINALKGLFG